MWLSALFKVSTYESVATLHTVLFLRLFAFTSTETRFFLPPLPARQHTELHAPSNFRAVKSTLKSVVVAWEKPEHDIEGYELTYATGAYKYTTV